MTAVSVPSAMRLDQRQGRRLLLLVLAATAALLYLAFAGQWTLPHDEEYPLFATLNGVKAWVDENRESIILFAVIREGVGGLVGASATGDDHAGVSGACDVVGAPGASSDALGLVGCLPRAGEP